MKKSNVLAVIALTTLPLLTAAKGNVSGSQVAGNTVTQVASARNYLNELRTKVRSDYYKSLPGLRINSKY